MSVNNYFTCGCSTALVELTRTVDVLASQVQALTQAVTKNGALMAKELDELTAQVAANTTVEKSALALIKGFSAKLDAAVAAALAAGATPETLAKLTALSGELKSADDELAAAVAANTGSGDPPPPPSGPPA